MSDPRVTTKSELLKTHLYETVKNYVVYDGQNRQWKVYTAKSDAKDGEPCIVTEYIYTGPAATTLKGTKEASAIWDDTWVDADFTV
jgi:hypothetical protein